MAYEYIVLFLVLIGILIIACAWICFEFQCWWKPESSDVDIELGKLTPEFEWFSSRWKPYIRTLILPNQGANHEDGQVVANQINGLYTIRETQPVPEIFSGEITEEKCARELRKLKDLQQMELKHTKKDTIRAAQFILLLRLRQHPTEQSLNATLIIGVDARAKVYGGYCVNLRTRTLEYYVFQVADLDSPWKIANREDSSEFEMKNFRFALCAWNEYISRYRSFKIYTDNHSIWKDDNIFGADARQLLNHFSGCENVRVNNRHRNENMHVNRKRNLELFAQYIQSADDFSRWVDIEDGVDFLCHYYGIERSDARGTLTVRATAGRKPWYDKTDLHDQMKHTATRFLTNFHCPRCKLNGREPIEE